MAATHLLLCCILCLVTHVVCQQNYLNRFHVSEAGRSVTVFCPPNDALYTVRRWSSLKTFLRPKSLLYEQYNGRGLANIKAPPNMSLNLRNFSLTVHSLQLNDYWVLHCYVSTGVQSLYGRTFVVFYNRWVEARYDTSVTLQCPIAAAGFTTRQWLTEPRDLYHLIYNQNTSGVTEGHKARGDMTLDTGTFDFTIGIMTLYDYIFTCSVVSEQTIKVDIIFTAVYTLELEAEENTSVTLPCDEVGRRTSQHTLAYTRTWQRVNGEVLYHQYWFNGVFYERRPAARADMSLNNETFALTIGRVQLEDNTMFVCVYVHGPVVAYYVESVKLSIYSQNSSTSPSITTGVSPLMKNNVSPPVTDGVFTTGTSEVLPPVTSGVSLVVIVGSVAAAAVLIIIIIVISVYVCVRRKAQHNKVTDQKRRTGGPSHRNELDVPDVGIRDETSLPRADYHEYEEITTQVPTVLPTDAQSGEPRYEKLKVNANTPIDKWLKDRDIPKATAKKLKRHDIITLDHLQDMSRADMVEAELSVGERNRIRKALKQIDTSQF